MNADKGQAFPIRAISGPSPLEASPFCNSLARTPSDGVPRQVFSGGRRFGRRMPVERGLSFGGVFSEEVLQKAVELFALAAGGFDQAA